MIPKYSPPQRRSFLARSGTGVAAFAAALTTGPVSAQAQSAAGERWQPGRHQQDDWLDTIPGKHRVVFDTTTPEGFGEAILFANNFMLVNQITYGVPNSDLAVVIVARHFSTSLAFNDAMWAKYGEAMGTRINFMDPKTKQPPRMNLYNSADYGSQLTNRGTTLDSLLKRRVRLAVCEVATSGIATVIADATGGNAESINKELVANLVSNSRMVPAGIVAVNRAQERGYSFVRA